MSRSPKNRYFTTPPLSSQSIPKHSDAEYLQVSEDIAENCWRHYESGHKHGKSVYVGSLGSCSYLRFRMAIWMQQELDADSGKIPKDEVKKRQEEIQDLLEQALRSAEDVAHKGNAMCTLLEGQAPTALALKSVILNAMKREKESKHAAEKVLKLLSKGASSLVRTECEVLYGRAGILQTILFLRFYLQEPTFGKELALQLIQEILTEGEKLAARLGHDIPLLWEWYDTVYLGAAHGVVGIVHTLLHFVLEIQELQKKYNKVWIGMISSTINALERDLLPSGNLESSLGDKRDYLMHWCHGSPGHVLLLVKASEVFENKRYLELAKKIAKDVVFQRGLLHKGVGLCHGISGNAYVFLALHRAEKDGEWLDTARHFANFALDKLKELVHVPDHPYSLYEGAAGLSVLLLDLLCPEEARFPCYEF